MSKEDKQITDVQLAKIMQMMDGGNSETEIIEWVESQPNARNIFEWFNNFIKGYVVAPKEEGK